MFVNEDGSAASMPVDMISTKYGWMLCPQGDTFVTGSFREWGVYSETEVMILRQLCANRSVMIIGGNIGALAVPLGEVALYVKVYEPQPLIFKLLQANVAINRGHVQTMWAAVGPVAGTIKVPVVDFGKAVNMGMIGQEHWGSGENVAMVDINTELEPCMGYEVLIIDAEGMELEILNAVEEPETLPSTMWVECDRTAEGKDLIAKIIELGYTPYWMINPLTPNGVNPFSGPWPGQSSFNLLCLRGEWPVELAGLPQLKASVDDPIGNCTGDKIIWNV